MSGSYKTPQAYIPQSLEITELEITDIEEGQGEVVKESSVLEVHYHGSLAKDGTVFDSSYKRGEPAQFPLTAVIEGWQKGLLGMKVGGARRLVIPSDMAYGEAGAGAIIGPNADLVFHVELIGILN